MPSLPFVQRASWIWSAEGSHAAPSPEQSTPSHYQVRLFRRSFEVADPRAASLIVHVSADSRYLLYCNGAQVGRGPAKGDLTHHFYETVDLSTFLRAGRNVISALVFDMSRVAHRPSELGPPGSVMTYTGGFLLEGDLAQAGTELQPLDTGAAGWRVAVDRGHRFQNDGTRFEGYHGYFEHRVSRETPSGWTQPDFDDSAWSEPRILYRAERHENRRDPTSPYGLMPRMIPPLEEGSAEHFADIFIPGGGDAGAGWSPLIKGGAAVTVAAGQTVKLILDTGRLITAYPEILTAGGAGAKVRLTYAEALRLPWTTPGAKLLGRPQSLANLASHFADESTGWTFDRRGTITGWSDVWEPAGVADEAFSPWHWRAFRYVGLEIATGEQPITIRALGHRFAAYPYKVAASFSCSDPSLERIWTVALHTMRLCSHETFEDCPHYEQMQYAGDTMITSKIAMLATGDYRLSRQALYHFDWSRLPEGLTQSRYPSRLLQVIPSWSLHWITNVRDYVYCSGDLATMHDLLPGARAVLDWFRRHVDARGLPAKLPFWNITDWCPWWPRGVVPGADSGPTCIISAQYIQALEEFADLCRLAGRSREAEELLAEARALKPVLHQTFWSEAEGLYFDKPGGPEVSQYGNAWAIACGAAGERERGIVMKRFPNDEKLAPGSFFWWHTGFRALERSGRYDEMPQHLGIWHEMVDAGLDTFVEENSYWRSLCHAWSAHPALEFSTRVLGVVPRTPGFGEIEIRPRRCGLSRASGSVCTPHGEVRVSWRVEDGRFFVEGDVPGDSQAAVLLPDGSTQHVRGGNFAFSCPA